MSNRLIKLFNNILFLWLFSLGINIITFLFIYYKIRPTNRTLALHFNILIGVDSYGKGTNIYLLPAVGLAIIIINFILYRALRNRQQFLSFLSTFVGLNVQLVILAAVLLLSRVN